jgi:hypothetical protein
MTTAPDLRDAVYHTLMQECDEIQVRAQCARRLPHLLGPRSQNEMPVHDERLDLSGEGVPLLAVHGIIRAENHHDPW